MQLQGDVGTDCPGAERLRPSVAGCVRPHTACWAAGVRYKKLDWPVARDGRVVHGREVVNGAVPCCVSTEPAVCAALLGC